MILPGTAYTTIRSKELNEEPLSLCKLIVGLWQTCGHHGYIPEPENVAREMTNLVERGFGTFELPGGTVRENGTEIISCYRNLVGARFANLHTQVIVNLSLDARLPDVCSRQYVESVVDDALTRMGTERIDLLAVSWNGEEDDKRYLEVFEHISGLRHNGKVRFVGGFNLPTMALRTLDEHGFKLEFCVAPYSLLDHRPSFEMVKWCQEHQVILIACSAVGGGFLSERWLGLPEPTLHALSTESLRHYSATIRKWGGWSLLQELLFVLKAIADKYRVSIANVALRWVLERPAVSAVIVGARLGLSTDADHFKDNQRVFEFALDDSDSAALEEIFLRANDLYYVLGDVGAR